VATGGTCPAGVEATGALVGVAGSVVARSGSEIWGVGKEEGLSMPEMVAHAVVNVRIIPIRDLSRRFMASFSSLDNFAPDYT
jgi:hypothetical protein